MDNNYNANLPNDIINRLEAIEVEAWHDLFEAASEKTAKSGGLISKCENNLVVSMTTAFDIPSLSRVIGLGLNDKPTESEIEKLKNLFQYHKVPRFMISDRPGENSPARLLEENGFVHHNSWIKFYRDSSPVENVKSDLTVKQIDRSEADAFGKLFYSAFDWPEITGDWLADCVGRRNWFHYLAYDKELPVACGCLYASGKNGWIVFGATLPEARGRGAQALITKKRIADAAAMGVELIAVETGQDRPERSVASYRNMLRCGFKTAYLRRNYLFSF